MQDVIRENRRDQSVHPIELAKRTGNREPTASKERQAAFVRYLCRDADNPETLVVGEFGDFVVSEHAGKTRKNAPGRWIDGLGAALPADRIPK
jgi:hypothetical protein